MAFDDRRDVPEAVADACADIFTICRGIPILHRRWPCDYEPDGCELEASQEPEEPRYKRRWPVYRDETGWICPVPEYQVDLLALLRDLGPLMRRYHIGLLIYVRKDLAPLPHEANKRPSLLKLGWLWAVEAYTLDGDECLEANERAGDAIVLAMRRVLKLASG